jgi:hypothetical protein
MLTVNSIWDPLKCCVLGSCYGPDFWQWVKSPKIRDRLEKISIDTIEDLDAIQRTLEGLGITVIRPSSGSQSGYPQISDHIYSRAPMEPRDAMIMIDQTFYVYPIVRWKQFYSNVKDPSWRDYDCPEDFFNQEENTRVSEVNDKFNWKTLGTKFYEYWNNTVDYVNEQHNAINLPQGPFASHIIGSMIFNINDQMFVGTYNHDTSVSEVEAWAARKFPDKNIKVVDTNGHSDGVFCPVCPGLVIAHAQAPDLETVFPGWEIVRTSPDLGMPDHKKIELPVDHLASYYYNKQFEDDPVLVEILEAIAEPCAPSAYETAFSVNILHIDSQTVMMFEPCTEVEKALTRHGITVHVVPFRHKLFWDCGIHCMTADLHRAHI